MDRLATFCREVFASLRRIDQRRAAESYLDGLLRCQGRKSVRQLAAAAPGRTEQSLQQFINQSPWDPDPVRYQVMRLVTRSFRPTAWAVEEVAFRKNGRYSAGVDRQYVRSLGRVCNCQLAISVVLVAGRLSIPVNWRLLVPESWGSDRQRRARARIPDHELPRPYWQYHVDVLDDMALEWGMPPVPVLVDARQRGGVETFLNALEVRHQAFLVQVGPTLTVGHDRAGRPRSDKGKATPAWWGEVGALVGRNANLTRETVEWHATGRGVLRSQFVRMPVRLTRTDDDHPPATSPRQLLIAEWPFSRPQPLGFWITNLTGRSLPDLVTLAKRGDQVASQLEETAGRFGLRDYEGRTFAGWHHHVTLVTAASGFAMLGPDREEVPGGRPAVQPGVKYDA